MKTACVRSLIFLLALFAWPFPASSENVLNSDSDYSVKIAVTINNNDHLVGRLEYSNHKPQFPLQLVTFGQVGEMMYAELYVFEVLERTIVLPNVHQIKCRSINDKYSDGSMILGTIDFRDESKPKISLVNEGGHPYLNNISEKGKETHRRFISNVWLGN